MKHRFYLISECVILFYVTPVCLYWFRHYLAFKVVPLLVCISCVCGIFLLRSADFDRRPVMRRRRIFPHIRAVFLFFIIPALCLAVYAYFRMNPHFLLFPKTRPGLWAVVMVLYPLLAALPQEIIFRCFFFHRYKGLFSNQWVLIVMNGVSFGLFHLFYGNWIAPVLTMFGGFLFAYRYMKTDSLVVVSIEHGLWGNFLFTIGIGWYFYSGSIH